MLEKKLATTFSRMTLLMLALLVGLTVFKVLRPDSSDGTNQPGVDLEYGVRVGVFDRERVLDVLGVEDLEHEVPERWREACNDLARRHSLDLITSECLEPGPRVEFIELTRDLVQAVSEPRDR